MNTTHWLELWTPLSAYDDVYQALSLPRPSGQPRALLKLFEQSGPSDPNWFEIDEVLDRYEETCEPLRDLGISPQEVSLWVASEHEDSFGEVILDPLMLQRMGEQGVKFCWVCQPPRWAETDELASGPGIPVNLRDLSSEPDEQHPELMRRVWVSLDDDTLWEATLTTYQHMHWQWGGGVGPIQVGTSWQPGVIVVPDFTEESLERAVIDLLRERRFEQAFTCLAGDALPAKHLRAPQLTLDIMHHGRAEAELQPLGDLLQARPYSRPNVWSATQSCAQSDLPKLTRQWLDQIQLQWAALNRIGIHRNDLAISWHLPYEARCHLEVDPTLMSLIAHKGMSLRLQATPRPASLCRCLDE